MLREASNCTPNAKMRPGAFAESWYSFLNTLVGYVWRMFDMDPPWLCGNKYWQFVVVEPPCVCYNFHVLFLQNENLFSFINLSLRYTRNTICTHFNQKWWATLTRYVIWQKEASHFTSVCQKNIFTRDILFLTKGSNPLKSLFSSHLTEISSIMIKPFIDTPTLQISHFQI